MTAVLCERCGMDTRTRRLEATLRVPGPHTSPGLAARARQFAALSEHLNACDDYARQARAARLANVMPDLDEVIHVLAVAMTSRSASASSPAPAAGRRAANPRPASRALPTTPRAAGRGHQPGGAP